MKLLNRQVYLGPNHYALFRVIRLTIDLEHLEEWPTGRLGRDFTDALVQHVPSLAEHGCSYGEAGGFLHGKPFRFWPNLVRRCLYLARVSGKKADAEGLVADLQVLDSLSYFTDNACVFKAGRDWPTHQLLRRFIQSPANRHVRIVDTGCLYINYDFACSGLQVRMLFQLEAFIAAGFMNHDFLHTAKVKESEMGKVIFRGKR